MTTTIASADLAGHAADMREIVVARVELRMRTAESAGVAQFDGDGPVLRCHPRRTGRQVHGRPELEVAS